MKKLVLLFAVAMITGAANAQSLKEGNLVGVHILNIDLKPGVSMDQFIEAYEAKFLPQVEKEIPEWKAYLVKCKRGPDENKYGIIYLIKSEKGRDPYYKRDGTPTKLMEELQTKIQPTMDELNELATWQTEYNDWEVQ